MRQVTCDTMADILCGVHWRHVCRSHAGYVPGGSFDACRIGKHINTVDGDACRLGWVVATDSGDVALVSGAEKGGESHVSQPPPFRCPVVSVVSCLASRQSASSGEYECTMDKQRNLATTHKQTATTLTEIKAGARNTSRELYFANHVRITTEE